MHRVLVSLICLIACLQREIANLHRAIAGLQRAVVNLY
jgi:hypothetical protein